MPIEEKNKVDIRYAMVMEYLTGNFTKSELSKTYNVGRPTLDKWINRFKQGGLPGLESRTSKPLSSPGATDDSVIKIILDHNEDKGWQAKSLFKHLAIKHPDVVRPSRTTIHNILERHGRTGRYNTRRKYPHPGKPLVEPTHPNHYWTIDYKGQFKTLDGIYCYPLTIRCAYAEMLLCSEPHLGPTYVNAINAMKKVFLEYGLPEYILSDNGVPFATNGFEGLSQLNIWWTELGIKHVRTQPSSPQQNANHERMHREMKRHCTRPPEKNIKAQRKRLEEFRYDYNVNLAVGENEKPPISKYEVSPRDYPSKISEPEYPLHFEVRYVCKNGGFRLNNERIPLSSAMYNKYIGLEEIDDKLWKVWFYNRFLGFLHEDLGRIEDRPERLIRKKK